MNQIKMTMTDHINEEQPNALSVNILFTENIIDLNPKTKHA